MLSLLYACPVCLSQAPSGLTSVIHAAVCYTCRRRYCFLFNFMFCGHVVAVVCLSSLSFSGPSGLTSAGAWHSLPQLHVLSVLFHVSWECRRLTLPKLHALSSAEAVLVYIVCT